MMRRRAAVSAIDLINGRGFLNRWSHKSGILSPLFSPFSSKTFQPKRSRIYFSRVKKLDDAIELFQKMKSMRPEPPVLAYNKLMSVSVKIEQYSFALHVFAELLRMGVPVNNYTRDIAVNCCCLLNDIKSGFAIMGFFFKSGYEPNFVTITTLIKGFFFVEKEAEVVKLLEKVLDFKLCESDGVMILHIISRLCKAGQVVAAHDWFHRLQSSGLNPNVMSYTALIDGYCKVGNLDEAWLLFVEVPGKGLKHDVHIYNTMIRALLRKGRFVEGWKLFENMEAQQIHPDLYTYNTLLDGICRNGEIEKALSFLRMIEVRGFTPDIVTYGSLIDGLCKNGKRDVARSLLRELPSKGLQPDVWMYRMIIDSLCQEGNVEEAERLLAEMKNHGCEPDCVTYNIIIRSLLKQNEIHKATSLVEDRMISDIIIRSSLKQNEIHKATSFMEEKRQMRYLEILELVIERKNSAN